jgi:WD40 repeat protein
LTEPLKHGGGVHSAQFSPDGRRIITASDDGTARVWDAQTGQPLIEALKHGGGVNSAQFSPDGRRVVTASDDSSARAWDLAPARPQIPRWLLQLSEAVSGQVLSKEGVLEPTPLNRVETIEGIRRRLNEEADDGDWVTWGRWFLADPSSRTISPFSKMMVPEYLEDRIKVNTAESLAEAEQLAYGNTELLERISKARASLGQTNQPASLQKQP